LEMRRGRDTPRAEAGFPTWPIRIGSDLVYQRQGALPRGDSGVKLASIERVVQALNEAEVAGRPQDLADIAELRLLHGEDADD
jgi:hypothetical protein